jgi:hypothetical protein
VPNNLGKVTKCESHVTTRLRYVHKQETVMPGSLNRDTAPMEILSTLEIYVTTVSIKLSVQNGASNLKDLVYGEALQPTKEPQ